MRHRLRELRRVLELFQALRHFGRMSDGSTITPPFVLQQSRPSLVEALEQLIACAERGTCPDPVLHNIRTLMRDYGLLLLGEGEAGHG